MHPTTTPSRPDDRSAAESRRRNRFRPTLERCERRTLLTTYTVTALTDAGAGRGTAGDLRYCLRQANADGRRDTITFAVAGTIQLRSSLPSLDNARGITIAGPGAGSLTVRGGGEYSNFQILKVKHGATATISGMTFADGDAPQFGGAIYNRGWLRIRGASFVGNSAGDSGGAINNAATLTVADSDIAGNSAGILGGGIYNSGKATISGSTIAGNSAATAGGGINSTFGTLEVAGTTLDGNSAGAFGGAISINGPTDFSESGGTLTVVDSTLSNNTAGSTPDRGYGGGIGSNKSKTEIRGTSFTNNASGRGAGGVGINGGDLSVVDSAFSGNRTGESGGAISINGGASINFAPRTQGATLSVARSSFAGNSARRNGGAIESISTTAKVRGATLEANEAGSFGGAISLDSDPIFNQSQGKLTLVDSTVSGNTAVRGGGISNRDRLTLSNATVTDNQAGDTGGGIYGRDGLVVGHSAVTGNRPDNIGGGT